MVVDRIEALRTEMQKRKIDMYIVPTSDFHESEYVGEYFKCRQFLTGFNGTAGTAVFTMKEAGLWTDGRYFVQAERQLAGSYVKLFRMGSPGVQTIEEFLKINKNYPPPKKNPQIIFPLIWALYIFCNYYYLNSNEM